MQHSGRTSPVGEDMEVSVNVSVVTVAVDSERAFLIRIPFDFLCMVSTTPILISSLESSVCRSHFSQGCQLVTYPEVPLCARWRT
jgi:hypothetical protein